MASTVAEQSALERPSVRAVLRLEAVARRFHQGGTDVEALRGVDLSVGAGEFVAVVGKSGAGKSTLLHLAAGLAQPDTGRVVVAGRDLAGLSAKARAVMRRRDLGFVFQFFHLLPSLTVAENVGLPLVLDGRRPSQGAPIVDELLDRVGLGARRDHLPGELSGGEMQRVAIARALVARPRLVLADEPTGNLDSVTGAEILDLLTGIVRDHGTSLLMVTHDAAAAARADRVLELADGLLS